MLAALVEADKYLGIEKDDISLQQARMQYPKHQFVSALSKKVEEFDSVVALAVIEHVREPDKFLSSLAKFLKNNNLSRLIVMTLHPSVD